MFNPLQSKVRDKWVNDWAIQLNNKWTNDWKVGDMNKNKKGKNSSRILLSRIFINTISVYLFPIFSLSFFYIFEIIVYLVYSFNIIL